MGIAVLVPFAHGVSAAMVRNVPVHRPARTVTVANAGVVSTVTFTTAPVRLQPYQAKGFDPARGLDVSIDTHASRSAATHFRYVLAHGIDSRLSTYSFDWGDGDADAGLGTPFVGTPQRRSAWLVRLAAGEHRYVTLRVDALGDGMVRIGRIERIDSY